jgi:hypothetical protein
MLSAPDLLAGASLSLLTGGLGRMTPRTYVEWMLQVLGLADVRFVSVQDGGNAPLSAGLPWEMMEMELTHRREGSLARIHLTCGVCQGVGQYSAVLRAYHAPQQSWERERYWLPLVAQSMVVADAARVTGNEPVQLPCLLPHDHVYGGYQRAWHERGISDARICRTRSEATMGYECLKDPRTGEIYQLPLELYDTGLGGYPNPSRPGELLIAPSSEQ